MIQIPDHLTGVVNEVTHMLMEESPVLSEAGAMEQAAPIVVGLEKRGLLIDAGSCEHVTSVGSTSIESPAFGEDEKCGEPTLLGEDFCILHI